MLLLTLFNHQINSGCLTNCKPQSESTDSLIYLIVIIMSLALLSSYLQLLSTSQGKYINTIYLNIY